MSGTFNIYASKVATILFCFIIFGCGNDDPAFNVVPFIEFDSYEVTQDSFGNDDKVMLRVYFEDGDGDIGLSDTIPEHSQPPFDFGSPYYHNLPVKFLVNNGGTYEVLIDTITNMPYSEIGHERVPVITPSGKSKSINGYLTVVMDAKAVSSKPKEVKFEMRLIDRALNSSETVVSPSILLKQ